MSITRLKASRTRYRNLVDKELTNGLVLLQDKDSVSGDYINSTKMCMQRLKEFRDKMEAAEESLSVLLEKEGKTDEIQQIVNEDCDMYSLVSECLFKLQMVLDTRLQEDTNPKQMKEEGGDRKESTMESFMAMQMQLQQQMQQLFTAQQEQIKQQQEVVQRHLQKKPNEISVKLPKLELPSYSGDKLKWSEFWDSFETTIHKNDKLSPVEKFNYLSTKLFGEAKRAISGLSLTNENYYIAVQILRERFGESQSVIDSHYDKLVNLPEATTKTTSLRTLYDRFETHLRSLEALGQNVDQAIFISIITSKLPKEVLTQLEIQKGTKVKWTIQRLREMLENYVTAKEKAEQHCRSTDKSDYTNEKPKPIWDRETRNTRNNHTRDNLNTGYDKQHGQRQYKSSAEVLLTGQRYTTKPYGDLCRYCEGKHYSDECQKFKTVQARKQLIKDCCFICLKKGHTANNCKADKMCVYCKRKNHHHRSLCPEKFQRKPQETVNLTEEFDSEPNEQTETPENVLVSSDEMVLMQTASTKANKPGEQNLQDIRVLLDSGSQRTYITESLAKRLNLTLGGKQTIQLVTFGSEKAKTIETPTTEVQVRLVDNSYMTITANVVPKITGKIARRPISATFLDNWKHLTGTLKLADSLPLKEETSSIDILIGNDYYLDIIILNKIEVQPGLYLLGSRLGWILTGRTTDKGSNESSLFVLTYGLDINRETSLYTDTDNTVPKKPLIEEFWKLENIGITDSLKDEGDDNAIQKFNETIQFKDNRYYLTWPWKDEEFDLPSNYELALGRLKTLINRLKQNRNLLERYDDVIQEQLRLGIIEKVPVSNNSNNRKHYIPHHAVITPEKSTTKVRIVYDASAKTSKTNKSLNECLYRGPILLKDLVGLLLRFRLKKTALVADIEKAFLQLGLQSDDRDVTRFIWIKDKNTMHTGHSNLQEYRFCRVPFGVISSPYLLAATVEHHLKKHDSETANCIRKDIYVDNVISGADSAKEAIEMYREAKIIFSSASMNLRDWMSNDQEVLNNIPEADKAKGGKMKVLGHEWNVEADTLAIKTKKGLDINQNPTKREVLKQVASIFDPMGLFSPVVLKGKLLLQRLWSKQIEWDKKLSDVDIEHWRNVCTDLQELDNVVFPRYVGIGSSSQFRIVCFCDASKSAYATAVYLHQTTGDTTKVDLIFAKSKVSPIKQMTIPRLELLAVLIGARAISYVKQQLQIPVEGTYLLTDSKCVLQWINTNKSLSTFVQNRINEVKRLKGVMFGHVSSKDNPADIASRGTTTKELTQDNNWWHGPTWLELPVEQWIDKAGMSEYTKFGDDAQVEVKGSTVLYEAKLFSSEDSVLSSQDKKNLKSPFDLDITNFSSKTKLLRVTAYAQRFIDKLKGTSHETGHLTSKEIENTELKWIKFVQGNCFCDVIESIKTGKPNNIKSQLGLYLDEMEVIRCTGRLQNAALSEAAKRPILLPGKHEFTKLTINDLHKRLLHSGVSQTLSSIRLKYWIPHGRSSVKSVIKNCRICRRYEGGPYKMPSMPQLPAKRVTQSPAFTYTGIDYLGPMFVKSKQEIKKVWICLYTCLVTRAIHLELMMDMTTEQFLLGLRRFVARRGKPIEITSDNAAQFKLAREVIDKVWSNVLHDDEVVSYVSNVGIKWKFIIELAPWMGGMYERLVGVVKRTLRKAVGKLCLTSEQLLTYLQEAEAVINSRPITYVGEDINSTMALTPSHFLTLNQTTGIPESEEDDETDPDYLINKSTAEKLLEKWKKGQKLLNQFWRIWTKEYLTSLRERYQTRLKSPRVQFPNVPNIDDVVLVKDDLPRGTWKIGRIRELITSRDDQVRSARICLSSGRSLCRALKLLYPIECPGKSEEPENLEPVNDEENKTEDSRPRRKAADEARKRIKNIFKDD